MAYQTGSATDLPDLLAKLNTFGLANGYTVDELDTVNGDWALSKNNIFVSGRWDTTNVDNFALYQALAFDGTGTLPGDHTDDSGHGFNSTSSHSNSSLDDERCIAGLGNGPFASYHFFENDSGPTYLHCVVQSEANVYKHFGFGELNKAGTWTGGEYCYGHYQDAGTNQSSVAADVSMLLDGINNSSPVNIGRRCATLHVEGLNGQGPSDKWAYVGGSNSTLTTDGNGNPLTRCFGGFRGGPIARHWGHFSGSNTTGFVPMYPICAWHKEDANDRVRLMGNLPDIRGINMRNFTDEQELVIGSDTWVLFPAGRRTSDNIAYRTYHQGIAYKKVLA